MNEKKAAQPVAVTAAPFSFMKYRYLYFLLSATVIIPGLISLFLYRVKPSIDFTGGSLLELKIQPKEGTQLTYSRERFQEIVGNEYQLSAVQQSGDNQVLLRGADINNDLKNQAEQKIQAAFGVVTEQRFETVGPVLGKELLEKTLVAGVIVAVAITLYVWYRFNDLKFGICAILAMLHDSLVVIGAFSLLGHFLGVEVDVLFVTALLTVLSFSIHDTIIVYDRIRENVRKHPRLPFTQIVDMAVLETLGRSINNSMTVIIMLLSLVLLGGASIHWFAGALLIGAITGTYSSTFTAAPLLLLWNDMEKNLKARRAKKKQLTR
jgi:preprotein translocase subunit SecF